MSELYRFAPGELEDAVTPWVEPRRRFTELVASWAADTPRGSHVVVAVQTRVDGRETSWLELGRWASAASGFPRTSVPGQGDGDARVDVDVLAARRKPFDAFRLRVTPAGDATLRALAAVTSGGSRARPERPSEPLGDAIDLDVPAFSQMTHRGHFPEYGGGGASWCNPASLAMVLSYWGAGPTPADTEWVGEGHHRPEVDHAARGTYDAAYGGCGNWSFGAAYAAGFGLDAVVTRLASLREVERLLRAGVPVVASIAAGPGELPGFPLEQGTAGHLLVVRGVTSGGDVVVNDPAAPSDGEVPRTYPRLAFERAWRGGSGGTVTVVAPLPLSLPEGNAW